VVRFIQVGDEILAAKEILEDVAVHEYRQLTELRRLGVPSVEPVGVVLGRQTGNHDPLDPILLTRHLLPHAAPPMLTVIGLSAAALLGGAPVVETVFTWPGVGLYVVKAIDTRDPVRTASMEFNCWWLRFSSRITSRPPAVTAFTQAVGAPSGTITVCAPSSFRAETIASPVAVAGVRTILAL